WHCSVNFGRLFFAYRLSRSSKSMLSYPDQQHAFPLPWRYYSCLVQVNPPFSISSPPLYLYQSYYSKGLKNFKRSLNTVCLFILSTYSDKLQGISSSFYIN